MSRVLYITFTCGARNEECNIYVPEVAKRVSPLGPLHTQRHALSPLSNLTRLDEYDELTLAFFAEVTLLYGRRRVNCDTAATGMRPHCIRRSGKRTYCKSHASVIINGAERRRRLHAWSLMMTSRPAESASTMTRLMFGRRRLYTAPPGGCR